jgi:hypothetical protein
MSLNDSSATEAVHGLRADVALGLGDYGTVYDQNLLYARSDRLNAARAYFWAGFAGVMLGDVAKAETALQLHVGTGVHGRLARLDETLIRAGIAALEGRQASAAAAFREALAGYRELGAEWRLVVTGLAMATLLDPATTEVQAAGDVARQIAERLRAGPIVEALDRALDRSAVRRPDDAVAATTRTPAEVALP